MEYPVIPANGGIQKEFSELNPIGSGFEPVLVVKWIRMSGQEEIFDMFEHDIRVIFDYWCKADPNYPDEPKWHPVAYPSLDVAAVRRESTCPIDFWIEHAALF